MRFAQEAYEKLAISTPTGRFSKYHLAEPSSPRHGDQSLFHGIVAHVFKFFICFLSGEHVEIIVAGWPNGFAHVNRRSIGEEAPLFKDPRLHGLRTAS